MPQHRRIHVFDTGTGGKNFIAMFGSHTSPRPLFHVLPDSVLGEISSHIMDVGRVVEDTLDKYDKSGNVIIACHTASSTVMKYLLPNNFTWNTKHRIFEPISPMCDLIIRSGYKNVVVVSTELTSRMKWHKKLLRGFANVTYIHLDTLARNIDANDVQGIDDDIHRLHYAYNLKKIVKSDCVVLGCTHYNIEYDKFKSVLGECGFNGKLLDSNKVLFAYVKRHLKV
jgi:glutamate racemase